jgi:hypothetical protein
MAKKKVIEPQPVVEAIEHAYAVKKGGRFDLEFSDIPESDRGRVNLDLDKETYREINILALRFGLFSAELLRRMIWKAFYYDDMTISELPVKPL